MGKGGSGVPGAADGGASSEVEVVVQAGEDGAEDVVVQRLRRRPAGAGAGADASAALQSRAPAPAPAAARLHAGVLLPHLTSRPVRDRSRERERERESQRGPYGRREATAVAGAAA